MGCPQCPGEGGTTRQDHREVPLPRPHTPRFSPSMVTALSSSCGNQDATRRGDRYFHRSGPWGLQQLLSPQPGQGETRCTSMPGPYTAHSCRVASHSLFIVFPEYPQSSRPSSSFCLSEVKQQVQLFCCCCFICQLALQATKEPPWSVSSRDSHTPHAEGRFRCELGPEPHVLEDLLATEVGARLRAMKSPKSSELFSKRLQALRLGLINEHVVRQSQSWASRTGCAHPSRDTRRVISAARD